jgi:creatinine amidohydrolase
MNRPLSLYWIERTTAQLSRLPEETVALLPVAAVEQHGPHLPVGTDTMINRGIVAAALGILGPDAPVIVLPEQAVGTSNEHIDYPGTLSHPPAGLMTIWTEVLDHVRAAGLKRCLIYNSHGGQVSLLQPVALEMRRRGMLAAYASWFGGEPPTGLFEEEEWHFGYHGGGVETSMMLHLRPDLVVAEKIRDYPTLARTVHGENEHLAADPGGARIAGFGWLSQDLNPQGAMGDARGANAEKGARLIGHAAARLAGLVREVSRFPLERLENRPLLDL